MSNTLELALKIKAAAEGLAQITATADAIEQMGGDAGQARAQAQRLTDELRDLSEAARGVVRAQSQGDARAYAAEQLRAADAVDRHAEQVRRLQAQVSQHKAMEEWRDRQVEATQATDASAASVGRLAGALAAAAGGIAGAFQLKRLVSDMVDVGAQFESMRVQLETLYGSSDRAQAALGWIEEFAKTTPHELSEVTQGFLQLKAMGLDPMDGTFQSIADQAAALGGGTEKLNGVILALGQAWTKQKLQGEEALQLIERGVPVWDLLAQATGRSTTELQKMSEQGKLGRDVIRALIDEMGRVNAGAATAQMQTFSGQVSNLRDAWTSFLRQIADAGVFDYLKDQLATIGAAVREMSESGELQRWATGISDALVTVADTIKGGVLLVHDYAGALKILAVVAGGLRLASLASSIAAAAGATRAASLATAAHTAALEANTAATGRNAAAQGGWLALGLKLARGAGWGAVALQLLEVAHAVGELHTAQLRLAAAEAAQEATGQRLQDRYAEISAQTGVTVSSMRELDAAVAAGALQFDAAAGKWVAAGAALQQARTHVEAFHDALQAGPYRAQAEAAVEFGRQVRALADDLRAAADTDGGKGIGAVLEAALSAEGGVRALAASIGVLRQESAAAGSAVERELAQRLENLTTIDLSRLSADLAAGLQEGSVAAEDFARMNDQILAASFAKLGLTAETELGRISPAAQQAIAAVDGIAQALDGAADGAPAKMEALGAAIEAAVNRADSTAALEALRGRVESLGVAGKLSGDQVAQALALIAAKTAEVDPQIQRVEAAFRRLGLQSQSQLRQLAQRAAADFATVAQSGQAAPEQIRAAFARYAQAAVTANNGVADAQLRAAAATQGLVVAVDKAGQVQVLTAAEAARANLGIVESQGQVATGYERIAGAAGTAGDAVGKVGKAAEKTGEQTEQAGAAASSAVSEFDAFASAAQQSIASVNQALSEDIQQAIQGATGGADGLRRALNQIDGSGMGAAADEAARLTQQAEAAEQAAREVMRVGMSDAGLGASEFFGGYLGQLKALESQALRAAAANIRMLQGLEREAARLRSSTAASNEDLRLQIMELDATDEQMAAARRKRALDQIQLEIKLQEIELRKASASGDSAAVEIARLELAALREKLKLTDEYYRKKEAKDKEARARADREEREAAKKQREQERRGGADGDASSRPSAAAPTDARPHITVNVTAPNLSDRAWMDDLARRVSQVQATHTRRGMS